MHKEKQMGSKWVELKLDILMLYSHKEKNKWPGVGNEEIYSRIPIL
jgi:hypothetical protein